MGYKDFKYGRIPTEWKTAKIADYTETVTDYVANGSFASLKKNVTYYSVPNYAVLLRLVDYNNNFNGDFVFIDKAAYNFLAKTKLYGGEIIISNVGANAGTVFKVPKLQYKMNLAPNSIMVRTKGYDPFYYYWFLSPTGQHSLQSIITGSAQPKFNKTNFKEIEIPIPSISEQKAIANILSELDNKIEINNQINEKLEEMVQVLFKHWFIDFEFPNENGEPYQSTGGEMIDSELGMIPKGWEVASLKELVEISNKSVKPQEYPNKLFEHYSIPAYDNKKEPEYQVGKDIKSNKYLVNSEVVLVSKLNPSTKRIWKPVTQSNDAICSTEFIVYVPKIDKTLSYVYEFLNNDRFQNILISNATGSTGSRQRVRPKETLQYKILLPKQDLILKFSEMVSPIHIQISTNMKQNQKLRDLRDVLLPKLISGEIRVHFNEDILEER